MSTPSWGPALGVSVVVSTVLAVWTVQAARRVGAVELELASVSRGLIATRSERAALVSSLRRADLRPPFLTGTSRRTGLRVATDASESVLLVGFSPWCEACRRSIPFLEEVSAASDASVWIYSDIDRIEEFDSVLAAVPELDAHAEPGGSLQGIMPTDVTPAFAVLRHGRIMALVRGLPDATERGAILALLSVAPFSPQGRAGGGERRAIRQD